MHPRPPLDLGPRLLELPRNANQRVFATHRCDELNSDREVLHGSNAVAMRLQVEWRIKKQMLRDLRP
jgi:hypothetical protein